ncbi:hypothetical protein S245_041888 [Arachis hypogaea]
MASAAFIEPLPVVEYAAQLLGKDLLSRQLSDAVRIKGATIRWLTREQVLHVDENSTMKSVVEYFSEMYGFTIKYSHLHCLQVGNQKKANYLPMEACKIVEKQHYTKRLNEKQITALLKVTCQRPRDLENDILRSQHLKE